MKTRHRPAWAVIFCIACGFAVLLAASAALAADDQRPIHDSIDAALAATAEEVAVQLKSVYGVQEVAIDGFQSRHSTAGPRLNLALRTALEKHLDAHGQITPAEWKQITGATRKWAIPLAEHFDAEKLTLRVGEIRKRRG